MSRINYICGENLGECLYLKAIKRREANKMIMLNENFQRGKEVWEKTTLLKVST